MCQEQEGRTAEISPLKLFGNGTYGSMSVGSLLNHTCPTISLEKDNRFSLLRSVGVNPDDRIGEERR